MAVFFLKREHDCGKSLGVRALPGCIMAYLIILAVDAFEIAGRKEDGSSAPCTGDGGLLAIMGQGAAYGNVVCEITKS